MKFSDIPLLKIGSTIQLVGAIYSGEGKDYLLFLPGEEYSGLVFGEEDTPIIRNIRMTPDDWKACLRQSDLVETEVLDGEKKAIVRKCERQIDSVLQWRVWKRDQWSCRYCGVTDMPLTVDHLILWEQGGPTIEANLLSCCKKCNRRRGNISYVEWLQSREYAFVSKNLPIDVKECNAYMLTTLDKIQRVKVIRSR